MVDPSNVQHFFGALAPIEPPALLPIPTEVRGFRARLELQDTMPPIWRRLELPGDLALPRLHDVIQAAMGWSDSHLHRFRTHRDPRSPYLLTRFDVEEGDEGTLEDDVRLDQLVAGAGDELWYDYDFGDGWEHRLVVEEVLLEPPAETRCTDGQGACPPEDCGGIPGYEELAAWVRGGHQDAHLPAPFDDRAHALGWLPEGWHPDAVDLEQRNAAVTAATRQPVPVTGEVAELAEQLERRGIRLLRAVLSRPVSHGPIEVSEDEAARLTESYRILLEVVGDGVALTPAGYLPAATVLAVAERTGVADWWIGKANREDLTVPVADIRSTARSLGLVTIRKGRLFPSAAAVRVRLDPQALWRHIVGRLPLGSKDGERHSGWMALAVAGSGVPPREWDEEISDLLYALGWRSGYDRHSPPPADSATLDVLMQLADVARGGRRTLAADSALAATARAALRRE